MKYNKELHVYYGFTHIPIPHFLYKLWKKFLCKRHIHLFDEVLGTGTDGWEHFLVCDACQLMIYIDKIDETYVKK